MDTSLWSPRPQAKKSAPNYVIEQIRQALLEKKNKARRQNAAGI